MNNVQDIKNFLKLHVNKARQENPLFFKMGPGEYAEHDKFLGVSVPLVRNVAKSYAHISLEEIQQLLMSAHNEERLLALFILVARYKKADVSGKDEIYALYVNNTRYVNNWNLVDQSAHLIVGAYLEDKDKDVLFQLAQSTDLWERRIAIIATWYYIKKGNLALTFTISQLLLYDAHDLIHKAVGWMLREAGKKDVAALRLFLDKNKATMPRTMLRYAIEKFTPEERAVYLKP